LGQLTFPPSSRIYFDTAPFIYSVEKHANYWNTLRPFWLTVRKDSIKIVTSNLTLLETLVKPTQNGNQKLIQAYTRILTGSEIELFEITTQILKDAVQIRAVQKFKTPDAIHAATAIAANCRYLVTNDAGFKGLDDINVVILDDLS
jgi:predicted nucleic acid-binding protein